MLMGERVSGRRAMRVGNDKRICDMVGKRWNVYGYEG